MDVDCSSSPSQDSTVVIGCSSSSAHDSAVDIGCSSSSLQDTDADVGSCSSSVEYFFCESFTLSKASSMSQMNATIYH